MSRPAGSLARAALAVAALLGSGCTISVESVGDDAFLRPRAQLEWRTGETTLEEVVRALGPPDELRRTNARPARLRSDGRRDTQGFADDDELWLVYRYRERRQNGFQVNYYVKVFSIDNVRTQDTTLVVAFDGHDKLRYWGFDPGGLERDFLGVRY